MNQTLPQILYKTRVPAILLLFAGLWGINTWNPHPVIALALEKVGMDHPDTIRIAYFFSMILYFLGLCLRIVGASILGSDVVWGGNPTAHSLEQKGLYRLIRHPIHLGSILILLALAPLNAPISAGLILFLAIPFILFLAHHEDLFLENRFPEFSAYKKSVSGFIPRINSLGKILHPFDEGQSKNISSGIRSEFFNIAFLGGFAGFIWGTSTESFWWGFGLGAVLTVLFSIALKNDTSRREQ